MWCTVAVAFSRAEPSGAPRGPNRYQEQEPQFPMSSERRLGQEPASGGAPEARSLDGHPVIGAIRSAPRLGRRLSLSIRMAWIRVTGGSPAAKVAASRARMAKLVDAPDLGSGSERSGGSSPLPRTARMTLGWPRLERSADLAEVGASTRARLANDGASALPISPVHSYSSLTRFRSGFGFFTRPGLRTPGPLACRPRSASICATKVLNRAMTCGFCSATFVFSPMSRSRL